MNKYAHISMRSQKPEKKRRCANGSIEPTALALSISRDLLKNKRVINILPNLQAYFAKRRYFPILMFTFAHRSHMDLAKLVDLVSSSGLIEG